MTLLKYIRANRTAPLYTLMWQAIFFAVGLGMVLIINTFLNEDPTFACMGSLMALVATLIGSMARGNLNGHVRFRLAISMGCTRKSYLLCDPIVTALTSLIGILVAWIMYLGEKALYTVLYSGFENDIPLDEVFSWKVILIIIAVTVVLDLTMSAMMQRFGTKGFLVIWFCFCGSFMILPRMIEAYNEGSTSILARIGGFILDAITTIPAKGWIAIGIAIALALIVFAVDTFRKAEAKF